MSKDQTDYLKAAQSFLCEADGHAVRTHNLIVDARLAAAQTKDKILLARKALRQLDESQSRPR